MCTGIETNCAVTDGDGDEFGWGRSGTDSKFTVTDGTGLNVRPSLLFLYHQKAMMY